MTRDNLKIAVIGGGSSYTPELVEGLIERHHELPVRDLYLVDIEEGREKLEIVGALAERMVDKAGVPMRVHRTFDRQEAIRGADFVTTQIRVGMLAARARDERIPLRYHRIGQETTGAGGFAKALRTIPVILDICREMEALAPNAFLLNFTNPAGLVTEAVLKHASIRSIGLCNLPIGTRMQVAELAGVPLADVDIDWVGINHLNWTTRIRVHGEDVLADVLNRASGSGVLGVKNIPDFGWDAELLRSLRALPCSYLHYYYMPDKMLEEELEAARTEGTRAQVVQRIEAELFDLYRDQNLAVKPPQLAQRGGAYYSLAAVNLISSIYNNRKDIQQVNVRNGSILPFLPPDASVEVNCVIDAGGAHPVAVETVLPVHMQGLLQVVKAYEALTVTAAVTGDVDVAVHALMVHPLVASADVARQLVSDIIEENRAYLPQFA